VIEGENGPTVRQVFILFPASVAMLHVTAVQIPHHLTDCVYYVQMS
jgi:hypothetical protein